MNNDEFIKNVRNWLIENLFRSPYIMFDDNIREFNNPETGETIDLMEVISSLYEIIHMLQYNETYDYMFHWANKCGSWVESDFFQKMFLGDNKHEET